MSILFTCFKLYKFLPICLTEEEITPRRKKRKGHKASLTKDLPSLEIHCELSEEERQCNNCHWTKELPFSASEAGPQANAVAYTLVCHG